MSTFEDKHRVRLECLNFAVQLNTMSGRKEAQQIIDQASQFEHFVLEGKGKPPLGSP